jgi:hypothetical protein
MKKYLSIIALALMVSSQVYAGEYLVQKTEYISKIDESCVIEVYKDMAMSIKVVCLVGTGDCSGSKWDGNFSCLTTNGAASNVVGVPDSINWIVDSLAKDKYSSQSAESKVIGIKKDAIVFNNKETIIESLKSDFSYSCIDATLTIGGSDERYFRIGKAIKVKLVNFYDGEKEKLIDSFYEIVDSTNTKYYVRQDEVR